MTGAPATLTAAAVRVLTTAPAADKVALTRAFAAERRAGGLRQVGDARPPDRPARPPRPELRPPRDMPRRAPGSLAGRVAFLHAIAHIELNAIDLAWDIIARFAGDGLPAAFFDDWVSVAADEAEHFALLEDRLGELGAHYGALPAHDGLWEAAESTADDLLARLAIVPMNLEARGLDTTPTAIDRLRRHGDDASAAVLARIADEEVGHVAAGVRWFEVLAARRGLDPVAAFRQILAERFKGRLKGPFNGPARAAAGMDTAYFATAPDAAARPALDN
ncbi:MAG: ferritin-like domain-containing protein [Hyphomicrobiales bacterium]|nr:ferritin-like domain-containing protein [Hyphomicrobiales bacterium]